MQSEALLKEHEVRRRDLLILKYDKQRTLCDEIIQRQRILIEGRFYIEFLHVFEFILITFDTILCQYFEHSVNGR